MSLRLSESSKRRRQTSVDDLQVSMIEEAFSFFQQDTDRPEPLRVTETFKMASASFPGGLPWWFGVILIVNMTGTFQHVRRRAVGSKAPATMWAAR